MCAEFPTREPAAFINDGAAANDAAGVKQCLPENVLESGRPSLPPYAS